MEHRTAHGTIPTPPKKPVIGNMLTVDRKRPLQSLMELTREIGPIFKLDMMGKPIVVVSGADLVHELCDENRFDKAVRGALRRVRAIGGDGLFTGKTQEPNWSKAHNILLPTFSRPAMNNYLPMMLDVAGQLVRKWERLNADDEVDVVHDMTAVALDTIGICGFNYRFNSFYRQDYHPFINALTRSLETCMMQRGLPFEAQLLRSRLNTLQEDVAFMNKLVDDIIRERRRGGADAAQNDLLNYMLAGVDKVTGESLSDENIRYQINTFLIAGHETTSGLMSFTLYFLLNHPDVLAKAYEEVDRVLGRDLSIEPTIRQVNQLSYIQQILYESLRLWPTAPAIGVYPYEDEVIGSDYMLKKRTFVTILTLMLHRDKSVWGDNADRFDPENFSREAIAGRPINAYKPFGNGQRACIGRQFAMQEATLVIGMILQRFQLFDHWNYELKIRESLTIKPDGFKIRVKPRADNVRSRLVPGGIGSEGAEADGFAEAVKRPGHGTKVLILYGSNLGTTEDIAREVARSAEINGFEVSLATLDSYAGRLPTTGAVIITSASYNGAPPDNAAKFLDWLCEAGPDTAKGTSFAVFGCGHSDWAATYQAIPRKIDEGLERLGAHRICGRGEADARDDLDEQFQTWFCELWPNVGRELELDIDFEREVSTGPLYRVEFLERSGGNPIVDQVGARSVTVLENRELQNTDGGKPSLRSTRHLELKLAPGTSYRPGDHLCVVPKNAVELVRRVEARFGLDPDAFIKLTAPASEHGLLPTDVPLSVRTLLIDLLELQSVASRKEVEKLAQQTRCPDSKPWLQKLAGALYREEVFSKRLSVLDLLERFPACGLSFGSYLEMLPLLAPRYYSISSSPAHRDGTCSITVSVVTEPAKSGEGVFRGVCSNHLARQPEGSTVFASVRETTAGFRLPADDAKPIIMIGPGTGIAPFRGFLQDRSIRAAKGAKPGPAMLFFGCRHPDQDFLYRDELEGYASSGTLDLHVAFSRKEKKKSYVQDLLRQHRDAVWALIEKGAVIYVCGDGGRMEPDVRRTLSLICAEKMDTGAEAGNAWLAGMIADGRYVLDVWVSG